LPGRGDIELPKRAIIPLKLSLPAHQKGPRKNSNPGRKPFLFCPMDRRPGPNGGSRARRARFSRCAMGFGGLVTAHAPNPESACWTQPARVPRRNDEEACRNNNCGIGPPMYIFALRSVSGEFRCSNVPPDSMGLKSGWRGVVLRKISRSACACPRA